MHYSCTCAGEDIEFLGVDNDEPAETLHRLTCKDTRFVWSAVSNSISGPDGEVVNRTSPCVPQLRCRVRTRDRHFNQRTRNSPHSGPGRRKAPPSGIRQSSSQSIRSSLWDNRPRNPGSGIGHLTFQSLPLWWPRCGVY